MATPSNKAPALTRFLEQVTGRTTAIKADICVPPPYGCGKVALVFADEISRKEYIISGLCQECQAKWFTIDDEGNPKFS